MKPKTSLILAAIAVVVLLGGWYFGPHQTPTAAEHASAERLLFPDLAAPLEKAVRIEVTHQGKTFAIVRKGDTWTLPSAGFYPVAAGKVHALLAGLVGLRLVAKRTSDPKQFHALGLDDPEQKGSDANLLRVLDASGHPIVSLIVGHERFSPQGNAAETLYVRRPGNDQTWLAEGALSVDAEADQWLDHGIANIAHTEITRIEVTRGTTNLVFAPEAGKLELRTPSQHPALDQNKLDDVWRGLEELAFSSVAAGSALPGNELGHTVFTLKDGTTLTATFAENEKKLWARFTVAGTSKEADALRTKLGQWNFHLDNWRESALLPQLSDLVQAKDQKP